ncbi:MAG TPA: ferrochelatase, partial [Actinobacteria bacterium]|nr:ferrochelatase [Actinomycetota bacterium]
GAANRRCYRAQCFATSRALAAALDVPPERTTTAFQSRMAGSRWIGPHTDRILEDLHARGVRRLAVLTPSFVADCLETLEEIGIRLRDQWVDLGGDDLLVVPCLNAAPRWVDVVAELVVPEPRLR